MRKTNQLFFSLCLIAGTSLSTNASPREVNAVAATVNGEVITEAEVQLMLGNPYRNPEVASNPNAREQIAEARENVLQDLIDREIILSEFNSRGGTIKDQYINQEINRIIREDFDNDRDKWVNSLAESGITIRKFRELTYKRVVVQAMRGQVTRNIAPPTPEEIKEAYKEYANTMRNQQGHVKMSKIFIPRESLEFSPEEQLALAKEVRQNLLDGEDFAELARQYSQDARARDGGSWPVMERKFLKDEIAEAAFNTPVGKISPLVTDEFGYHIIRVEAREYGHVPPLEEVREQLVRHLQMTKRAEAYENWIAELRKRAVVRAF